jgi:putative flippase GtrA
MNFLQKFTKKDLGFAILTGLITGTIAWRIFNFLNVTNIQFRFVVCDGGVCPWYSLIIIPWFWFVLIIPILWILGVLLGYFLGQWLKFFNQFGKFAAIGFTNAAVDFGVLNLLIANTGFHSGGWYTVFKAISFMVAVIPSYFWNKYWAFEGNEGVRFEFAKFLSVAVVSIFINDGVASFVVNYVQPFGGLSSAVWANVGAMAGSAVALVFSFVGFKLAVFKK